MAAKVIIYFRNENVKNLIINYMYYNFNSELNFFNITEKTLKKFI